MDLIASMAMPQLSAPLPQAERAGEAFSALLSGLGVESASACGLESTYAATVAAPEPPAVPLKPVGTATAIPDLRPILGDPASGTDAAQPGVSTGGANALSLSDEWAPPDESRSNEEPDVAAAPLLTALLAAQAPLPPAANAQEAKAATPLTFRTPGSEPSQGATEGTNAPLPARLCLPSTPLRSAIETGSLTSAPTRTDLGAMPAPRRLPEGADGITGVAERSGPKLFSSSQVAEAALDGSIIQRVNHQGEPSSPTQSGPEVREAPRSPLRRDLGEATALGRPADVADKTAPEPRHPSLRHALPSAAASAGHAASISQGLSPAAPAEPKPLVPVGASVVASATIKPEEPRGPRADAGAAETTEFSFARAPAAAGLHSVRPAERYPKRGESTAPAEVGLRSSQSTEAPSKPELALPHGKGATVQTRDAEAKRPGDPALTAAGLSTAPPSASAAAKLARLDPAPISTAELSAEVERSDRSLMPQSGAPVPGQQVAGLPGHGAKPDPQRRDAEAPPSHEGTKEPVAEGVNTLAPSLPSEPAFALPAHDRPAQPELRAAEALRLPTDPAPSRASHVPPPHPRIEPDQPLAAQLRPALEQLGERPVEIRLDPAELGKVSLTLNLDDTRPQIVIGAERPETLDLFRRHAETLIADFRALGFGGLSLAFGQSPQRGESEAGRDGEDAPPPEAPSIAALPAAVPRLAQKGAGVDLRS